MTTQALTLVAPVSASTPTTATQQIGSETDSFASVLASQNESTEGSTDSALALSSHTSRDKQTEDAKRDASEQTDDSADSALSMIATTLFIAAESASIQQGLRQHLVNTGTNAATPGALASEDKTTTKLSLRSELHLRNMASSKNVLEQNDGSTARHSATTEAIPENRTTRGETTPVITMAQPTTVKADATVSLLSKVHITGKTAAITDNIKPVLATLAATQLQATASLEGTTAQDAPIATSPMGSIPSSITALTSPASSPVLHGSLSQPVDSPAWGQEFSKTMLNFSRQGIHHAELRLDPPELGPLRISLKLSDNVAHAYIVCGLANLREDVEQALPQLQHALAQSGLSLGHTDVSDQASDQAFLFQQHSDGSSSDSSSSHFEDLLHGRSPSPTEASAPPIRRAIPDALVDTFA